LINLDTRGKRHLKFAARDLDFIAFGLDFVAVDFEYVSAGLGFIALGRSRNNAIELYVKQTHILLSLNMLGA